MLPAMMALSERGGKKDGCAGTHLVEGKNNTRPVGRRVAPGKGR